MTQDGLFRDQYGDVFHYKWKDKNHDKYETFRLEQVTYHPGALKVPPIDVWPTYDELDRTFILIAERGGGFKTFNQWIERQDENKWQIFSLRDVQDDESKSIWKDLQKFKPGNYLLDRTYYGEGAELFPEDTNSLAQIASILEHKDWTKAKNRFICATYDTRNLSKDILFSALLDKVHIYRLPQFSSKELVQWVEVLLEKHGSGAVESTQKLKLASLARDLVGGQPRLTHNLFNLTDQELRKDNKRLDSMENVFHNCGRTIRRNPPNVVNRWKKELKDLLISSPSAKTLLEIYSQGNVKPEYRDYTPEDKELYLTGWVAMNSKQQWGIRSDCHRDWAIQTLRGEL